MTNDKIHTITSINSYTLIIFYTQEKCWQFRVISPGGDICGEMKIYYSAEAAETAGGEWVR
ncbi:MAG: hypothetical protein HC903_17685 [Methylacidiphilales bacterium]|nr:hypothetical protein [Candidatus Methylacidiphilales bacterium]NJR17919.1 hypothetical protein [Calothrix sp. CSU_2_0]